MDKNLSLLFHKTSFKIRGCYIHESLNLSGRNGKTFKAYYR